VSPGALKNFDTYVKQLAEVNSVLPIAVITTVVFNPNVTHVQLAFGTGRPNPNMEIHWTRREEAKVILTAEPTPRTKKDAKSASKKKTTKKKTGRRAA